MATIRVVTDSTCDIPDLMMRQTRIAMVPLSVNFGAESFRDRIDITHFEFMDRLASSKVLPTTSQPPPGLFEETYRQLADEGADGIVSLHISEKLSGTLGAARIAAEAVTDRVPVEVIDSQTTSLALGFIALAAARAANDGADLDTVAATARKMIPNMGLIFFADTLEYLQKGGRIGRAAAIAGSILSLKPLMRLDEGVVVPHERTRTRSKAIDGLARFVNDFPHISQLGLMRTGHADTASLLERLSTRIPQDAIIITEVSPVIAVHLGPGGLGVAIDANEAATDTETTRTA